MTEPIERFNDNEKLGMIHSEHGHYCRFADAQARIAEQAAEIERLRKLVKEVWDSVPSSFDDDDPMVKRHHAALYACRDEAAEQEQSNG